MDVAQQILQLFHFRTPDFMLLGKEVLHDIAKVLDPDAQLMKRNLGAIAQRTPMQIVGPLSNVPERDV